MTVAYTVWLTKEPAKPHRISAQDRILDVPALNEAMEHVAVGETVVEPALVEDLVSAPLSARTRWRCSPLVSVRSSP